MKSGLMLTIFKEKDSSYYLAGEPRQTTFWSSRIISDILRTFYVQIIKGRGTWKAVLGLWKLCDCLGQMWNMYIRQLEMHTVICKQ